MRDSPELFQLMDEFKSKVCGNKRLNCRSCITYSLDHILADENCNTSSSQSWVEVIICTSQGFLVIIPFSPRTQASLKGCLLNHLGRYCMLKKPRQKKNEVKETTVTTKLK